MNKRNRNQNSQDVIEMQRVYYSVSLNKRCLSNPIKELIPEDRKIPNEVTL